MPITRSFSLSISNWRSSMWLFLARFWYSCWLLPISKRNVIRCSYRFMKMSLDSSSMKCTILAPTGSAPFVEMTLMQIQWDPAVVAVYGTEPYKWPNDYYIIHEYYINYLAIHNLFFHAFAILLWSLRIYRQNWLLFIENYYFFFAKY